MFDAIKIAEKGVWMGRMIDGEFIQFGSISYYSIKEIYNGSKVKIKKGVNYE